ncbi:MAG TPA: uracil-DNA glycosylase [Dissulfurispiraceae bacterium]|nr:uracil-DNA glycosylase [Dissulfurispiraceae bacterium]
MANRLKENICVGLEYFKALGFEHLPVSRAALELQSAPDEPELPRAPDPVRPVLDKQTALRQLGDEIGDCKRCRLSEERTNIVFGEGDLDARIMFIGEAPGREEDQQARPFVGEAGKLLTKLIEKMGEKNGFGRKDVYIANIVKCRPPMNRDPHDDEMRTCSQFLIRQIEIIQPEVIVSLGRISAFSLSGRSGALTSFSITRERGKFFEYKAGGRTIPVMPTFHPAYLMRNPKDKWLTWEDALAVLAKLGLGEKTG